jgi:hypothetical protein
LTYERRISYSLPAIKQILIRQENSAQLLCRLRCC